MRFCIPLNQALIWMEVDDLGLFAHYESGFGGYGIYIEEAPEDYAVPQDMESGFAVTLFGQGIGGVTPPGRARAFTTYKDMAIIQIEGGDKETQLFVVEVHTPRKILRIEAVDYSIEFDPDSRNFEELRSQLLHMLDFVDQSLFNLMPLDKMEPFP